MSDISDRVPSPADRKVFLTGDYKEEQLRAEFLNPFFESLGLDVANKAGLIGSISMLSVRQAGVSRFEVCP
jgi:hypothetical protein